MDHLGHQVGEISGFDVLMTDDIVLVEHSDGHLLVEPEVVLAGSGCVVLGGFSASGSCKTKIPSAVSCRHSTHNMEYTCGCLL